MLSPEPIKVRAVGADLGSVRFQAFRAFAMRMGFAVALMPALINILWMDPQEGLTRVMVITILTGTFAQLLFPLAILVGLGRGCLPWFLYGGAGGSIGVAMWCLSMIPHGYSRFLWAFLYPCLFTPMLSIPFTLRENTAGLLVLLLIPPPLMVLGLAPGFPLLRYYAMVGPALAITAYFKYLIDGLIRTNEAYRVQIEELAHRDGLTGLYNRRYFMDEALRLQRLSHRAKRPSCFIMFDLDHFKKVNDQYGHGVGDQAIQAAAQALRDTLRETDLIARYGGEEFIVFLPDTDLEEARIAAERVREAVHAIALPLPGLEGPLRFTASLGVSRTRGEGDVLTDSIATADQALYLAKGAGRNRVAVV